ncbi:MAG TPA: efflux RND transporter periplasmic adaptor subunit [Micromonosporaceae bacterium]
MPRRLIRRIFTLAMVSLVAAAPVAACSDPPERQGLPGMAGHGTVQTTVKPTRQDLTNKISLTGKVTMNPVYGLAAPVAGEVRYFDVKAPTGTPTKPTRVASIWAGGRPTHVEVPAGSVFAGRLTDDRATVPAGMPVVTARFQGYGVVADLDGSQAYLVSDALAEVQAQVRNGPGPFRCTVLGTIAALPQGTIPEPPPQPSAAPSAGPQKFPLPGRPGTEPSEPTGLRVVCIAPPTVRLINGATVGLELVTARATNVLVLPVEAVAGGHGQGRVDVVGPDGARQTREVTLGLSDGKMIEIKSGLTGDETIAVPGPNLPGAGPVKPGGSEGPAGAGVIPDVPR